MSDVGLDDLATLVEGFGIDEVFEHLALVCRETSDQMEDAGNEEAARQWRVRGNGMMQALRFYQNFVKERDAS